MGESGQAKYRPYPAYKPSGVEWLGDIPEGWDACAVRHKFTVQSGDMLSANKVFDEGTPVVGGNGFRGFTNRANTRANTLVIGRVGAKCGCIHIIREAFWASEHAFRIIPRNDYSLEFMAYSLAALNLNQFAITTAQPLLNTEIVTSKVLAFPSSIAEQTKIAAFLDHEAVKIDGLIAKQQQLIALLEEKRQAVISHAVTKGLDPTAPLRSSGIDWLGDVPAHWEVCRLKHVKGDEANAFVDGPFGSNLKSDHFSPEGEVFVIESSFATTGKINAADLKKISRRHFETIRRSAAKAGDIILAKIGARYGMSSILPELGGKAVVSGNSLKLTVNRELVLNSFALELLRHLKLQEAMDENVNVTAQPALSLGGLNNLPFLKVPLKEQEAIVEFLLSQKNAFERLLFAAQSAITLLKERRTALISAAVTGKIDLRDWQPPEGADDIFTQDIDQAEEALA
jgi:type I restriction enzyme S subunit